MAIISRLAVLLGLDAGEFNANLGKAKDKVEGFSAGAKLSLGAVAVAFTASAREAINFADKINDVAKANEMSVQSVLRMSQALSTNGGNADDAGKLMASLANKIDEAAQGSAKAQKAFTSIGISLKDLRTLSPDELFQKTVQSLAAIEDPLKRNAMAMELLGRGIRGVDIKGMAADFETTKSKFLGADEAFKSIGNSVDRLDRFFMELKVNLATKLAPAFESVTIAMENWLNKSNGIVDRFAQIKKEAGWWAAWKDKEGFEKYEFAERGSVQGANVPSIMSGIGGVAGPKKDKRDVVKAVDKEAEAEAKKAKEALQRQQEFYDKEMLISQAKSERLQKEYELAFVSENERKLQLEIYDIEQKRKQLTLGDQFGRKMTEEQANKWAEAEKARAKEAYAIAEQQRDFEYGWKKAFATYTDNATNAAKLGEQAFVSVTQNMEQALDKFVQTGKLNFKELAGSIIQDLIRIQLKAQATSFFSSLGIGDFFSGIFGGGSKTAFSGGIKLFADGGSPPVGVPSIVGEKGPELFIPKSSGTIIPNNQLGSAMGNQPQVVYNGPYIQNMSAIDTQSGLQFLSKNKQAVWAANQSAQRSIPQSR
ncbi:tail length tape-measure protein 1 [Methylophilaceae phage P19250A]|nr:tail length tape-measure protein 1 [Methylophilaceae phage P19250A]